MRSVLLFITLSFLPGLLVAQSPWAISKSSINAQLGYLTIPSYTALSGAGGNSIEMIREVSEHTLQFYGEYGLSNNTTASVLLPYRFNNRGARNPNSNLIFAQEDTGSISGFGNITLAIRHQFRIGDLSSGNFALGGHLHLDFPAGKSQYSAGLRTGYDAMTINPMMSAGMSFSSKAYWFAYGGFGFRTNDYSHFTNFGASTGVHLWQRFWLMGITELVLPLENGSRPLPPLDVLTGLYVNDQGWFSVGITGSLEIAHNLSAGVHVLGMAWAQNITKSPKIGVAINYFWQ